jgi:hypothetical protein
MNDTRLSSPKIHLGKCWQTAASSLVFQASIFCPQTSRRKKGFLVVTVSGSGDFVKFQSEKPQEDLNLHVIASLVRKYCTSSQVTALALSHPQDQSCFLRLRLEGPDTNKATYLVVSRKPQPEINLIVDDFSLGRLQPQRTFTIKKPAARGFLDCEDLSAEQFELWASSLVESKTTQSNLLTETTDQTFSPLRRQARDKLTRRLRTLKKTLLEDQKKLPASDTIDTLKTEASILSRYLWLVEPDQHELTLDPGQTGDKPRTIALDPDKSPGENLERIFIHIKKLERTQKIGGERALKLQTQIQWFEQALVDLKNPKTVLPDQRVMEIMSDLGLSSKPASSSKRPHLQNSLTQNSLAQKFVSKPSKKTLGRIFPWTDKITIVLGRDAKESDQLVKSAKSNDWWVHLAGGGRGSHVLIKGLATKEVPPDTLLRAAGILALHFSERRQAMEGEVYLTRRQFLRKTKGLAPGLWLVDKSQTLRLRYDASELAEVFAKEIREGIQRHRAAES